jgi:hypothetical protein
MPSQKRRVRVSSNKDIDYRKDYLPHKKDLVYRRYQVSVDKKDNRPVQFDLIQPLSRYALAEFIKPAEAIPESNGYAGWTELNRGKNNNQPEDCKASLITVDRRVYA